MLMELLPQEILQSSNGDRILYHVIEGGHRFEALKVLREKYPNEDRFMQFRALVYKPMAPAFKLAISKRKLVYVLNNFADANATTEFVLKKSFYDKLVYYRRMAAEL